MSIQKLPHDVNWFRHVGQIDSNVKQNTQSWSRRKSTTVKKNAGAPCKNSEISNLTRRLQQPTNPNCQRELRPIFSDKRGEDLCCVQVLLVNSYFPFSLVYRLQPFFFFFLNTFLTGGGIVEHNQLGNYTHICWSCPQVRNYWKETFQAVRKVVHVDIQQDPRISLLRMTGYLMG